MVKNKVVKINARFLEPSKLSMKVDMESLNKDVSSAIEKLNAEDYEVTGITAITSGHGGLNLSYTEGVLILAKKG